MNRIDLRKISKDGQMLIAIYKVSTFNSFQQLKYMYKFTAVGKASGTICKLLEGGILVWAAHDLRPLTSLQ